MYATDHTTDQVALMLLTTRTAVPRSMTILTTGATGCRDGGSTRPAEKARVKPAVNVVHPTATARRAVVDRHKRHRAPSIAA
jgi:hypothetical protein